MKYNIFGSNEPRVTYDSKDNVFADFLLTHSLYDSMEINESNISNLISLLAGDVRMSVYCRKCKAERVFHMQPYMAYTEYEGVISFQNLSEILQALQRQPRFKEPVPKNAAHWGWSSPQYAEITRILIFKYICAMDESHHLDFVVLTDNNRFTKIGQYPSVADLSFPELDGYKKVLSAEERKNMGRAIGLFASGIGIGSYVYLRRVLERLLMKAKEDAGDKIDEQQFREARIKEKISLLKDYLPPMLTDNPAIYGILSKGIHELTEEECLAYFPVVKDCIYMILDEWEDMRKRREKELSIKAAISQIASKSQ